MVPQWEPEVLGRFIGNPSVHPSIQQRKSCSPARALVPQMVPGQMAQEEARVRQSNPGVCGGNGEVQGRVHLSTSYPPLKRHRPAPTDVQSGKDSRYHVGKVSN